MNSTFAPSSRSDEPSTELFPLEDDTAIEDLRLGAPGDASPRSPDTDNFRSLPPPEPTDKVDPLLDTRRAAPPGLTVARVDPLLDARRAAPPALAAETVDPLLDARREAAPGLPASADTSGVSAATSAIVF